MAPAKKRGNRGQKNNRIKNEKLASFIKDFDSQVKTVVEELKANVANSLKEVETLYNIELIKLPAAIREMRWLDYFAKGGKVKALEAAATVNVDIEQITSSVSQTPFKPPRKAKKAKCNSIENDEENIPVQSVLRPRTNAKASTAKKLATTRKTRVSAANTTAKRTSKRSRATPSNSKLADSSVLGYTPMITPRIDTRAFKTPALRTPSIKEPVYTFSANGSPLGGMDELFINLPSGDGKNIRLTAEDMEMVNLSRLDKKAFENIKLLSSRLEKLCKTLK
ncbi:PREDICTED: borealin [Nanorana parkeri]|uniref:borealin n=1 Tax=Nanorana parkeri TaxID=125878 RepID=UPI00085500E0|nr:PREDICTED: borealin [Nanorana parkeri]